MTCHYCGQNVDQNGVGMHADNCVLAKMQTLSNDLLVLSSKHKNGRVTCILCGPEDAGAESIYDIAHYSDCPVNVAPDILFLLTQHGKKGV